MLVHFSNLFFKCREIGVHRGRDYGFAAVFGFSSLRDEPFIKLASKVKRAYEGSKIPSRPGWPEQREALRFFVDKGRDGIYAMGDKPVRIKQHQFPGRYYIDDGHHRALALYILNERAVSAKMER